MKALIALSLLALLFAGCTTDEDEFVTPEQDDEDSYVIEMTDGLQFNPQRAEVPVGSTVVWKNTGSVPHDTKGPTWESNTFGRDEEFETTMETAGEFAYECTLHSGMDGVLRVV